MRKLKTVFILLVLCALFSSLKSQTNERLALTPPMGWNSWNKFGCNVSEKLIKEMTDAIVKSGMKDAGYQYIVIDDCWHGARDENGFITANAKKFPSGMMSSALLPSRDSRRC